MKQAILSSVENVIFKTVDFQNEIKPNEILIQVKRIGICGSDIHAYKGKHPFTPFPVVQGHEYSGEIIGIGAEVTKFQIGDKVTGRPQIVCGVCQPCVTGKYNVCQNLKVEGFQAPGVAQDYFILPEDRAYKIDSSISFDEIALIEPAAVGAHATSLINNIENKNIVISGAGPIGILIAQFAKVRGAKNVIVTDFNAFRLEFLNSIGILNTIDLSKESFRAGIQRILGKENFQVGIEAVGNQHALNDLVSNVEKAGEVIIVGVYEEPPVINMSVVGEHELNIKGSMMYTEKDYEEVIQFLNLGKLDLENMITKRFEFLEYNEAYQYIEENQEQTIKVLINVNL